MGSDHASYLDLGLLTAALFVSALLTVLPSPRVRAQTTALQTSTLHTLLFLILPSVAVVLAIVSLVLGWTHRLSLDALSAVAFALVPALFNMPRDLFVHLFYHVRMSSRTTLRLTTRNFFYVRVGRACSSYTAPDSWPRRFPQCRSNCDVRFYLRFLRRNFRADEPFHQPWQPTPITTPTPATATVHSNAQWFGTRVFHTRHCVVLRDINYGPKAWWFNAIKSATWLVANPALARLDTAETVLNALALLADIVVVGDLILHVRREFLQRQLAENNGLRRAASAAPAFITNHILREVGLTTEWGTISSDMRRDDFVYPAERSEEYALLFFVLTEKSSFYSSEIPLKVPRQQRQPQQQKKQHNLELHDPSDRAQDGDLLRNGPHSQLAVSPNLQTARLDEGATTAQPALSSSSAVSEKRPEFTGRLSRFPMIEHVAAAARSVTDADVNAKASSASTATSDGSSSVPESHGGDAGGNGDYGAVDAPPAVAGLAGASAPAPAPAQNVVVQVGDDRQVVWSRQLGMYMQRNEMRSGLDIVEQLLEEGEGDVTAVKEKVGKWVDDWLVSWGVSRESLQR